MYHPVISQSNISLAKFFLYFLGNGLSLNNIKADSFPEDDVHGGGVGESDHHLDNEVSSLIDLGQSIQINRVVYGGVPARHRPDARR